MKSILQALVVCAVGFAQICCGADSLDQWALRNPLPQGNHLSGVTYGNGTFVAVGASGTVLTSADGVIWTSRSSGILQTLYAVTYGNGTFVAVGDSGTILTSSDGVTWTSRSSGIFNTLKAVSYNASFVAVGGSGTILTSPDGVTWTSRISGTSQWLLGITYGNGNFVAVADSGAILTSPDGVNWTSRSLGVLQTLTAVSYGNGNFVAVGDPSTIMTSSDGVTWTSRPGGFSSHYAFLAITYGNSGFVAVGLYNPHGDELKSGITFTSPDGGSWIDRSSRISPPLSGISFGNDKFVAVGQYGTILTSPDGVTWTSRSSVTSQWLFGITYGDGNFVAVGTSGTVLTSADGVIWISRSAGTSKWLYAITTDGGTFVAVGDSGTILTSSDGVTWTSRSSGIFNTLKAVSYGNGNFVAVGGSGTIFTSADGVTWTSRSSGILQTLYAVTYGNGTFVAVGDSGTILTSLDGVTWTSRSSGIFNTLKAVSYNASFVAVGGSGTILTSPDGVTWTSRISGTSQWLLGITYGNGNFVAVGGTVLTSADGVTWISRSAGTSSGLAAVSSGDGSFVAVGPAGTILQSGVSTPQGPSIAMQPQSQTIQAGATVNLTVAATGTSPLSYQWRRNGVNIPGATNLTLTLNSVTAANSDCYSVLAWNSFGSAVSDWACLAVLTDSANGNNPPQFTPSPVQSKPNGANNLVFVTHGWQPKKPFSSGPPSQSWMVDMTNAIAQRLAASGQSSSWQTEAYYWLQDSWTTLPNTALDNAERIGALVGKRMAAEGWQHVHLIAHSAGAKLIQAITYQLKSSTNPPSVQETFLDPFTGRFLEGRGEYGLNADWADNYFVINPGTELGGVLFANFPGSTSGQLEWAYNVDVGATLSAALPTQYVIGNGTAGSTPPVYVSPSHGSPIDYYASTIDGTEPNCAAGYGFSLSIEAGGSAKWVSHPRNNPPYPLCGMISFSQNQQPVRLNSFSDFSVLPYNTSSSGVDLLGGSGASLNSTFSIPPLRNLRLSGIHPLGPETSTNIPPWLAVGVSVTNALNFAQFDATFSDTNGAEGLLTVYWNTNQIGMVDERVAIPGLQTYRFALPGTVTNGVYTLSFRLDAFNNTSSSVIVTNLSTGFVGVTQPMTLDISLTAGAPLVELTAATDFTYLIQNSTNLLDWRPMALILNTYGTAQFLDSAVTNSRTMFYRALMP